MYFLEHETCRSPTDQREIIARMKRMQNKDFLRSYTILQINLNVIREFREIRVQNKTII